VAVAHYYVIYAVSDDDQPVIDAVTGAFPPEAVTSDDGEIVTWRFPGREARLWRGDYAEPDISTQQVRQIFVWDGGAGKVRAALDVIDTLRSRGIDVIIDTTHQELMAADRQRD
jgi:hypothetical protein